VAADLGLLGHPQRVNVSVLNGQVETFETTPVECVTEQYDATTNLPYLRASNRGVARIL